MGTIGFTSSVFLPCFLSSDIVGGRTVKSTECRLVEGSNRKGLVRGCGVADEGKALISSSRWLYRGKRLISQTVLQPVPIPKAEGPWRRELLELIGDILSGVEVQSVLEPWIDGLSVDECNKLMVEVGNRDWCLAMDVFRFLKERSPYIQKASLCKGEVSPDSDGKSLGDYPSVGRDGLRASGLLKAYTTLVGVLSRKGRLSELTLLLHEIEQEEVEPDVRFYNGVAEAYSNLGMVPNVSDVLAQMERSGLQPDHATFELMIAACLRAKVPQLDEALLVFRSMLKSKLEVGVKTYVRLIDACVDAQDLKAAEEIFSAMRSTTHQIYSKTWVKMLHLHASAGGYKKAEELFRAMRAAGVLPTASIYDSLLLAYCRAGCLDQAFSVFREYKLATKPSLVAYNYLIDASGKRGRYEESLALYSELSGNGMRPTNVTYTSLICAVVQGGQHEKADRLYKKMLQKNLVPTAHTVTAMLHAYTSCGWTRLGHEVCTKLKEYKVDRTVAIYGAMLKLYVQGRWYKEAAIVMREMEMKEVEPDAAGYGVLISALGESEEDILPLANAMGGSDWEPCRVGYFLVSLPSYKEDLNSPEDKTGISLEKAWLFFQEWAKLQDKDANRSLYNALMDALWRRGFRRRAQLVMQKARALLPWFNRPRFGVNFVLDLRGLSVGGAQIALLDWLDDAVSNSILLQAEAGHTMVIVTGGTEVGVGKSAGGKVKGVGAVKQAVTAFLEELCSPFREGMEFPGRVVADTDLVLQWLSKHRSNNALKISDCK